MSLQRIINEVNDIFSALYEINASLYKTVILIAISRNSFIVVTVQRTNYCNCVTNIKNLIPYSNKIKERFRRP